MGPFEEPRVVLRGFKERPEALLVEGDKLLIGTSGGNLHVHVLEPQDEGERQEGSSTFRLSKAPKSIEALGYMKDISSLVVLMDGSVSLLAFPLQNAAPKPRILPQTKGALCFAVHSTVVRFNDEGGEIMQNETSGIPSVVSCLVVGLRRKIVIYTWKDGEELQLKELTLPHTPRAIQFFTHRCLLLAYTPTDHVTLSLPNMSITEVSLPPATSSSTALGMNVGKLGMGNLGSWSMGMGGANKKPVLVKSGERIFIPRENQSLLINGEGDVLSKTVSISEEGSNVIWPAPMEETTCLNFYLVSLFPPNTLPFHTQSSGKSNVPTQPHPGYSIQIRSYLYPTSYIQTYQYPFLANETEQQSITNHPASASAYSSSNLRLLSPSSSSTVYTVSVPTDRSQFAAEGVTIWALSMKKWLAQVDELIGAELYEEALTLMASLGDAELPEKGKRVSQAKTLLAVQRFVAGDYLTALRALAELDINPARVLGLFPELVSGRLSVPREGWVEHFGGNARPVEDKRPNIADDSGSSSAPREIDALPISGRDSIIERQETVAEEKIKQRPDDELLKAIEALLEYLPDRRRKVQALIDPPLNQQEMSSLSSLSLSTLLDLPSVPAVQLKPEELTIYAQLIDTALFTAYLVVRPGLIGPLCRIGNWCEVKEVEGLLRAREKYTDLVSLYSGKRMHAKALNLLKEMATGVDDDEEQLGPSIRYLQKLGPEYIEQIFESSRWILQRNQDLGFQIFISEDVELSHPQVCHFLESIDSELCIRYLHYLINEREEPGVHFHNHLGLLLISVTRNYKLQGNDDLSKKRYQELLHFLDKTTVYQTDRLYGALPSDGMFEARAILLGRLGRHEGALDIYVHQLQDYVKAEEYCVRVYAPASPTESIFLSLLRTFLRPQSQQHKLSESSTSGTSQRQVQLQSALELISRHSPRLDPFVTLDLLPPLCTSRDVRQFLVEVLRIPIFETRIQREIWRGRKQQASEHLAALETQRVKVTDSRICPNCQKRLGNTVIAVHLLQGEVTHYHCREAYTETLRVTSDQRLPPMPLNHE